MSLHGHARIDARLLRLVEAVVDNIDGNPSLRARLADNLSRWSNPALQVQWRARLNQPWSTLRQQLLAPSEEGAALRQDAPLGGLLSPDERLAIMREFPSDARPA